jgi:hypothetical protein
VSIAIGPRDLICKGCSTPIRGIRGKMWCSPHCRYLAVGKAEMAARYLQIGHVKKDLCSCGGPKCASAAVCRPCKSRSLSTLCACGGRKASGAPKCLRCYLKTSKNYCTLCGGRKGGAIAQMCHNCRKEHTIARRSIKARIGIEGRAHLPPAVIEAETMASMLRGRLRRSAPSRRICACGQPKSLQAATCRTCYYNRRAA